MKLEAVLQQDDTALHSRATTRRALRLAVQSHSPSVGEQRVVLHNISRTGLLIEAPDGTLEAGDTLFIDVPEDGTIESVVVWESGRFFGCRFSSTISQAAMSGALLQAEPQAAERDETIVTNDMAISHAGKLEPQVNFSAALLLAFALWAAIGAGVYLAIG